MRQLIKYLVMDVDGTLTDGKIYMGDSGELFKAFNIKDGCGIHDILIPNGVKPVIITGRSSTIVENRCKELGVTDLFQGEHDKLRRLNEIVTESNTKFSEVAYIGDDINDLKCMQKIKKNGGMVGCPADAVREVVGISDYVCSCSGGEGAVREFIEWLIEECR